MIVTIMVNALMEHVLVIKDGKEKIVVLDHVRKIVIFMAAVIMVHACVMQDIQEKFVK